MSRFGGRPAVGDESPTIKPGTFVFAKGEHDVALSELTPAQTRALHEAPLPWLNSLGLCTIYDDKSAERVRLRIGHDGEILGAVFYRERSWMGVLRRAEIFGFPDLIEMEIHKIIDSRGVHVAIAHRMEPPCRNDHVDETGQGGNWAHEIEVMHDVIVELPQTKDAYLAMLGKQKRRQLPRYWRRIQREHQDQVSLQFESGDAIQLESILELLRLSQARMMRKGKDDTSDFETQKQRRRWPMTQSIGLLCTMKANGKLLGGTLMYVQRGEAFAIIIGHDPALEHLHIGSVCLWKSIEHMIELGVMRCHLLWGKSSYKTQFGGLDHPIMMQIVARRRWMAAMWRLHTMVRMQVPRGMRFLRFSIRRLFGGGQPKPAPPDQIAAETSESDSGDD